MSCFFISIGKLRMTFIIIKQGQLQLISTFIVINKILVTEQVGIWEAMEPSNSSFRSLNNAKDTIPINYLIQIKISK